MAHTIDHYAEILRRMEIAALAAGRTAQDVQLLAVSKRQSVNAIRRVAGYGQQSFGENYLQEAQAKMTELADLSLDWHYIGRLQSNKTGDVARLFNWVHSLDRLKIARRLDEQRPESAPALNVFVEVNISGERSKGGIEPDEVPDFVASLASFDRLRVRGLMALPSPESDISAQRQSFRQLCEILAALEQPQLDGLSMGTSSDFEAAIAEGATLVRIGTALFGPRD